MNDIQIFGTFEILGSSRLLNRFRIRKVSGCWHRSLDCLNLYSCVESASKIYTLALSIFAYKVRALVFSDQEANPDKHQLLSLRTLFCFFKFTRHLRLDQLSQNG